MTADTMQRPAGAPADTGRPGPLGRLADLTFRYRGRTVLVWLAVLLLAIGLSGAFGGEYRADYSAPGSDSSEAQDLLETRFPTQAGDIVDIVVHAEDGVQASSVRTGVQALIGELGTVAHVESIDDPYATPGSVSEDGQTLVAHARLDVVNPVDMPVADS